MSGEVRRTDDVDPMTTKKVQLQDRARPSVSRLWLGNVWKKSV